MHERMMTTVYILDDDRWLLLERHGSRVVADGAYTGTAGGHFEQEELGDPRACVLRELFEETGLTENDIEGLKLRYICLRNTGKEIRMNHYYFASLKNPDKPVVSNEGILRWFQSDEVENLPMPLTAKYAVSHYLREGQFTDKLYTGIIEPEDGQFVSLEES